MHWDKLLTIFLFGLFLVSFASALEFDNRLKSYDSETETVIINDNFGFGGDLVKVQLIDNTYVCGTECSAIINITIYSDEDNFLTDLVFEQIRGSSGISNHEFEFISSYDTIIVNDYTKDCSNREESELLIVPVFCERVLSGTHEEQVAVWATFDPERKLPIGNYVVKITGNKKWSDTIDWIPTFYGEEIRQWAFWAPVAPTTVWEFNEIGTALTVADTLGLNDLTILDSTLSSFGIGKLNNALNLTGNGVRATANNSDEFAFDTGDFTLAMWVNITSGGSADYMKTDSSLATGWGVVRETGSKVSFGTGGLPIGTTVDIAADSTWHRVVFVREGTGSNQFKVYLDNDNQVNATLANNLSYNTGTINLSAPNGDAWADDFQFYKGYAWTVADVDFDYNGGTGREAGNATITINLNSPADAISLLPAPVSFNCSAIGLVNIINVTLYLDGVVNSTTSGNSSIIELSESVSNIGIGTHNWTCTSRAEDNTFDQVTNRTFTISEFVENSQTFNALTYETSLEAFVINVSFNSSEFPVSTATLNYNGTGYTGTTSDTGDNKSYSTSLNVPELDISKNISFYWAFVLTNATGNNYFNSTINNQSSGIINASILNNPYTIPFINFTTYDQDTLTQLTSKISNTFGYGISSIIQELSYSDQTESTSSFEYAFDPPHLDYIIEGDLLFTKANYVDNNYVLLQQTITNATTNISIYLLNSSRSASFIIQLRDSAFDNVAGAIIESQRFYPSTNTWVTVESFKTNIEGKTIGHFVLEDVNYRFLVYVDTVLVLTSTPTLVFCEETPCTINLQLPSTTDSAFANFENLDDYTSNLVYDKTTETFTFSYIDAESGTQGGRLRVVRTSLGVASNVEICDDVDGSGTGILTCDISSETNGTYIASGYSNRTTDEDRLTERIAIAKVRDIVSELGIDGLLWSAILFISIALLFLISPAVGIVGSIFALIGIFLLGLVSIQPLSLFALISVAAILLWVITR